MENITTDFALQANNLINEGKFEKAISLCNNGLSAYPHYPSAYCVLAKAYYFSENQAQAAEVIKQARKHFPYNAAIKRIADDITNKTLIYESVPTLSIPQENIIQNENEMKIESPEEELIQVVPEDIPDNFSQEIELIDEIPASYNDNLEEAEYEEDAFSEEKSEIEATEEQLLVSDELEENCQIEEEEFQLIDDESYFPRHVHQESIADILDIEESEAETNVLPETDIQDNAEEELQEATDFTEENVPDLEAEEEHLGATFMPEIPQRESSLVFDTHYDKSAIELLYEADFDLPKTSIQFNYSNYSIEHISDKFSAIPMQSISFAHLSYNIGKSFHDTVSGDLLEDNNGQISATDSILDLAESLKNAKISAVIEPEEEDPEVEMPLIASETMAKILVKQKKYDKAQQIYELLLQEKPEKTEYFNEQIILLQNMV